MLACILELSDPPYSRCLRIAKSRIHFEPLVVDFKLRTGCVVIAPWQKRMPFCKAVPFRVFREKRCLLGTAGNTSSTGEPGLGPKDDDSSPSGLSNLQ